LTAAAVLVTTALYALLDVRRDAAWLWAAGLMLAVALATLAVRPGSADPVPQVQQAAPPPAVRVGIALVLHLAPVVLLMLAFPFAAERMAGVRVDGVRLSTLVLAGSVTVPWLSHAVSMPIYEALGSLTTEGTPAAIRSRFCAVWPSAFLLSLPLVVATALTVGLTIGWPFEATLTYLALCLLHTAFAQSLIPGTLERRRTRWALAWAAYSAGLLVVPTLWFVPPLLGLASQVIPLRQVLLRRLDKLDVREAYRSMLVGLLLGSVLWADKLFLFLMLRARFEVTAVFVGLLPAVVAYSLYFVAFAPRFDATVRSFRSALERESHSALGSWSESLAVHVLRSVTLTGLLAAALGLALTLLVAVALPEASGLVAAVAVASCLFIVTTLACYKLDYVGERRLAASLSALHLLVVAVIFTFVEPDAQLYVWLAALEIPVTLAASLLALKHWRTPEYTLFWRHATTW
jgi:hypothetical protein